MQGVLGKYGIICIEDLIHEIYTVGPHFKEANNFLHPFQLSCAKGAPPPRCRSPSWSQHRLSSHTQLRVQCSGVRPRTRTHRLGHSITCCTLDMPGSGTVQARPPSRPNRSPSLKAQESQVLPRGAQASAQACASSTPCVAPNPAHHGQAACRGHGQEAEALHRGRAGRQPRGGHQQARARHELSAGRCRLMSCVGLGL